MCSKKYKGGGEMYSQYKSFYKSNNNSLIPHRPLITYIAGLLEFGLWRVSNFKEEGETIEADHILIILETNL